MESSSRIVHFPHDPFVFSFCVCPLCTLPSLSHMHQQSYIYNMYYMYTHTYAHTSTHTHTHTHTYTHTYTHRHTISPPHFPPQPHISLSSCLTLFKIPGSRIQDLKNEQVKSIHFLTTSRLAAQTFLSFYVKNSHARNATLPHLAFDKFLCLFVPSVFLCKSNHLNLC